MLTLNATTKMAGTAEVISTMEHLPGVRYPVLVPNMKGLEDLLNLLASENPPLPNTSRPTPPYPASSPLTDEIAVFTAATDAFTKANTNCTIAESLERLAAVTERALAKGLRVRGCARFVVHCSAIPDQA